MVLSRQEELELVSRARAGDREATARLVEQFRRRIQWYAWRFRCRGLWVQDQYHTGVVAFLEKLREFMPERGTRLWTFAQHAVRGRMIKACADQQGLSEDARRRYRRVADTYDRLWQERQSEPTPAEVAQQSNVSETTVKELFAHWEGRTVPLLDEGDETEEGKARIVLRSGEPLLEESTPRSEEIREGYRRVTASLGPADGCKFLILAVLHEKVREDNTGWYEWAEIANLLSSSDPGPSPSWNRVLSLEFSALTEVPANWADVWGLFQVPPPVLTAAALRQWYRRTRSALQAVGGMELTVSAGA